MQGKMGMNVKAFLKEPGIELVGSVEERVDFTNMSGYHPLHQLPKQTQKVQNGEILCLPDC